MNKKFVFDKKTGTYQEDTVEVEQPTPQEPPVPPMQEEAVLEGAKPPVVINPDEPIIQFRETTDYTVYKITDDRTGRPLMIIAGYGLEIKFNMQELRSTAQIEKALNGLTTLFRKVIVEQALGK